MESMSFYRIEQPATGAIIWRGRARTDAHALDLLAQAAGYDDHASACDVIGADLDELIVTEIDEEEE